MGTKDHGHKIIGLNTGSLSLDSRSTWSWVWLYLFEALKETGFACDVYDVEPFGPIRRGLTKAVSSFPSPLYWRYRFLEANWERSWAAFHLRSRRVARALKRVQGCDSILQTSSTMFPGAASPPLYLYVDSTLPLAIHAGIFSVSLLSKRILTEAFEIDHLVYDRACAIFTFSEWCKESIVRDFGISPAKVHAVGAGINLPENSVGSKTDDGRTILFVGKNFELKGGPLLLEAFRRVRREMNDARLVIAGCSPKIDEQGVTVIGYIDRRDPGSSERLAGLYRSATLFVLPSYFETFGIAFLEAMYSETPCIALRRCAFPEFVVEGETGSLVSQPEPDELADAIVDLLKDADRLRVMGQNARQMVSKRYTWRSVAQRMKQVMVGD